MNKLTIGLSALALAAAGTAIAANHGGHTGADADNDGTITSAEAQAHTTAMFQRMDANSDGRIDETDRAASMQQRKTEMFAKLDANGNGQISREEFMAFEHEGKRGGHHRMGKHGHRGGKMMEMADANNDGAISQAKFTTVANARFRKMDANGDGSVTAAERDAAKKDMRGKWREKMRDRSDS